MNDALAERLLRDREVHAERQRARDAERRRTKMEVRSPGTAQEPASNGLLEREAVS
jgi:hypothetical protein